VIGEDILRIIQAHQKKTTAVQMRLDYRSPDYKLAKKLEKQGLHPLLASLFSARGIEDISDVRGTIEDIIPTYDLLSCREMATLLADCVQNQKRVLIISDYDCDGATACTVLVAAFRACGMNADYLVPDREIHGYGLTESIVLEAAELDIKPDFIITVDAGISSTDGVNQANALGIDVLVTDHHHAPAVLPKARLIVNPNQHDCTFPSKNIAGCGVAWYIAKALSDELLERGVAPGYDPAELLQFVALGTVADVVPLDKNNRILVREGLKRIRAGNCTEGMKAIAAVAGKTCAGLSCVDFGFALGPRINAAGRLAHMSTGIECLLSMDPEEASRLARELHSINEERKQIQKDIVEKSEELIAEYLEKVADTGGGMSLVVYEAGWHQGVIGVVAGRIKEDRHRPTFVMCDASSGVIKGSGRSIPGFHLKHALDRISVECPGVIATHGGHPMAAGVSVHHGKLEEFKDALERICREEITPQMLERSVGHDGAIPELHFNLGAVKALNAEVWGQGFSPPLFVDTLRVVGFNKMGKEKQHLKINVAKGDVHVECVAFSAAHRADDLAKELTLVYKVDINNYNNMEKVQLMAEHFPEQSVIEQYNADMRDAHHGQIDDEVVVLPDVLLSTQRKKGFRML
jgi:single-stranded-DNA-specific exonuclease